MTATATARWRAWSTDVELTVTAPALLDEATRLCVEVMASVDAACSRYRPDSELSLFTRSGASSTRVSPQLAELLGDALAAAELTDGLVDPTLGHQLSRLDGPPLGVPTSLSRPVRWADVTLEDGVLTAPPGTGFDLGAIGKASACEQVVRAITRTLGPDAGALVGIGGDLASTVEHPDGGWQVSVQDRAGDPAERVALTAGAAIATSSTQHRRHRVGAELVNHILDPRSLQPVQSPWRTVTCAAVSCVEANAYSTAAVILGHEALPWLAARDVPARFVDQQYTVSTTGAWPTHKEAARV
ncbi:FAD:protein FMN transferase [Herbiconiux sp. KACC 21604]|uniref:FAD:protein FMN transferase n=1 Tax=unclassified Herbiconiux TaxID=2618217 RepID=UPI001491451F|nr:FAD:protein FMN transferase [Herbiconiux sp. SALV-R1]QJU53474.1 FAD:protein FMN transferase [Herbiconiux sp. SALV-R1]WPO88447.1 FAD:protein FMN transferase [Herbiconiux sp. KACC 21604]